LSIAIDGDEESKLESEKYKATALIEYMRSKDKIPEVGSTKQREPGSQMTARLIPSDGSAEGEAAESEEKKKTNNIESSPAFKNIRLNENE